MTTAVPQRAHPTRELDATRTTADTASSAAPLETVPKADALTMGEVAATLADEATRKGQTCSVREARRAVHWLARMVQKARKSPNGTYFPSTHEMKGLSYRIIDAVIPHDAVAAPDSAHAVLQRFLLDPTRDEFAILHDQRHRPSYPGEQVWCSYQVCVGVVPLPSTQQFQTSLS